jgi:GAF domain-containing protein
VIMVARQGCAFADDNRDLLRSLASQATLALENVQLHHQVQRQAMTDELTGLSNRGRFQELGPRGRAGEALSPIGWR